MRFKDALFAREETLLEFPMGSSMGKAPHGKFYLTLPRLFLVGHIKERSNHGLVESHLGYVVQEEGINLRFLLLLLENFAKRASS